MDIINEIQKEVLKAESNYGNFNSTHEAYAVLKEEVDEFWDVIKKNTERNYGLPEYKVKALIPELIQIAAIAIRTANELQNNKIKFV
jgi:Mg2+ and Co2+ transporter CorA